MSQDEQPKRGDRRALSIQVLRRDLKDKRTKLRLAREKITHLEARIRVAQEFMEERFGNDKGNDWTDEAAGEVADVLDGFADDPDPGLGAPI